MKKYAFFDFDKTLSSTDLMPDILTLMEKQGLIQNYTSGKKDLLHKYNTGKIDYNQRAVLGWNYNIRFLKGTKVSGFLDFALNTFQINKFVFPWVDRVMDMLISKGFEIIIVSASLQQAVELLKNRLKASSIFGTIVEIQKDIFTEKIIKIMNASEKETLVASYLKNAQMTLGVGDSIGDFEMLRLVDKAFLYSPQDQVMQLGIKEGFTIINADTIDSIFNTIKGI